MMASIPNMRSTRLPVPPGKAPPAGDQPSGEFAARLPATPGQPGVPGAGPKPRPHVAQPPAVKNGPKLPDILGAGPKPPRPEPQVVPTDSEVKNDGDPIKAGEDEAGVATTRGDAPQGERVPPVGLPLVPAITVPPTPPPTGSAGPADVEPVVTGLAPAPIAGQPGRRACGTEGDGGKPGLPLPAIPDGVEPETKPAIEPAVKDALLRKLALTRQMPEARDAAHSEGGQAETVAPNARAANPESSKVAAPADRAPVGTAPPVPPATAQAAAPLPAAELPQPTLAPAIQAGPVRADAAGTTDATRSTDLAVERQLDLARDSEWLDRLARDIARAGASDTPLRFRLHPQTLGHLHVELQQGDHGTAVRLTVETEAARQLLADAQPRLAAEARAQGVRIAETHVDLSGSGRHAPGEQRRQDDAHQTPQLRTARSAGEDAVASARPTRRAGLDRYA